MPTAIGNRSPNAHHYEKENMSNTALAVANNEQPIVVDELVFDQGVYGLYERAKIRPSPDNRKRFNEPALHELAASIKAMGVAQAILIRPVTPTPEAPEEYEIVAGERRWRASGIAGLTHIPALCRRLSDLDAAKIRILENLQREDPHPMEEAEGYQLLMLQHGFTADQLVDEIKKSRAYIYGRLKLCALTTEVRELFLDNKLPASTALLIARIPVPALQVKAANEILKPQYGGEPLSVRAAASHIQSRYMLHLGSAVFSLTDAKLLAAAGACTKCPKRAGNQPEVFEGIDANVCTDPDCFSEKKAAHHNAMITLANKKGIPVYEGPEAAALLNKSWMMDSELTHPNVHLTSFARNAPSTKNAGYVRDYLKGDALPPVAAYAKFNDGTVDAYYRRTDMQKALEAAGACETVEAQQARLQAIAKNPGIAPPKTAAQLKQEKQEEERKAAEALAEKEETFRLALYKQLRQRAGTTGLSLPSMREFVKVLVEDAGLDSLVHDFYEVDVRTDLDHFIDQADANALQLVLIDAILGARIDLDWFGDNGFGPIMAMARHEGIDPDQVREELFPSPIDVTNMQYGDLVGFIKTKPHRINELNDAINASPRGDLTGQLEQAATSLGYVWRDHSFVLASEILQKQETTLDAPLATDQADATALTDTPVVDVDQVKDTPLATEVPATVAADQNQETQAVEPAPATDGEADAEQLAAMVAEDTKVAAETTVQSGRKKAQPKAPTASKKPVSTTAPKNTSKPTSKRKS